MSQSRPQSYQPYAIISVSEPVLQKGPNNEKIPPYVTYLVSGQDPHGNFNIRRRFRQFLVLRNKFVGRFIGMYVPPIPSKREAGNTQERYVEERRRFLNYFCLKIADRPYLFDSDIFQTFIRGDPDYERAARSISGHEYALIANIYDVQFRKAAEEADIPKTIIEIESEAEVLKLVEKRLTTVRSEIQEIAQAKSLFINQYAKCKGTILPRYESDILTKHGFEPQQYYYANNQNFKEKLNQYIHFCESNHLLDYAQSLTYDIRQARALLEAIETRRIFEEKKMNFQTVRRQSKQELERLQTGRMSIKSFFTSGTKDIQIKELQSYIPQYERNEAFLGMCLPLSAIAIHQDLQKFKQSRAVDYLGTLQFVAQKQMRLLNLYGQMILATQSKNLKAEERQESAKTQ